MRKIRLTMKNKMKVIMMMERNYASCWDMIGLSNEVATLKTDYDEGSTFLAVDTGDIYILYQKTWYKL